jgi:predicted Zn finger-like uncharacterized protein
MAMITRCPACDTVFRISPPQLLAQNGTVRCGRCLTVFDGFKTLSTAPDFEASESAAPDAAAANASTAESTMSVAAAPEIAATDSVPVPMPSSPEPTFELESVSATELAAAAVPIPEPAAKSGVAEETRDFGPAPEQLTLEDHLFLEETREANARRRRLWGAGAALLLLALTAQAVYAYRGEIAAYYPGVRPYLARMCDTLHCAINLPQRPRVIAIEASDLQATDPARPGAIHLTATVRNHGSHDVGFPALDLVLTNTRDHTLARRIFLPHDYLEPGRDPRAGIPANAEMTINLDLDTGDLNAAGFRLDLLAAPTP